MKRIAAAAAAGVALGLALAAPALAEGTDDAKLSASAEADCGTATVTFVNNTRFNFWADVRVDGEEGHPDDATALGNIAIGPNAGKPYGDRYQKVTIPANETITKKVTFPEDSGDHKVEYRIWRGPETDWYVDWQSVDVKSDCEENAPPATNHEPKKCEAYLYTGTKQNLCDAGLPEDDKVNCSDVKYQVTLVDPKNDPWGLDGSGGGSRGKVGVGCESNPLKPVKSAKQEKSTSPAPAAGVAGGSAASLPVTGSPVKTMAAVAGGGLLVGGLLWWFGRRREKKFVA